MVMKRLFSTKQKGRTTTLKDKQPFTPKFLNKNYPFSLFFFPHLLNVPPLPN